MINLSRPILPVEDNPLDFNFALYVFQQYWLPHRECRKIRSEVILFDLKLPKINELAVLRRTPVDFDNSIDAAQQIELHWGVLTELKGGSCDASSIYR